MCFCKVTSDNIYNIFSPESFLAPDKGKKYSEVPTIQRKRKKKVRTTALDLDMVSGNYGQTEILKQ